jgi:hypothetical protein
VHEILDRAAEAWPELPARDQDGFVFIVDRTKDMILCGGYNVYPRNIEEAIYEHPSVAEVCVIGVPDAYRGQSPKAFIKLRDGAPALGIEELKRFLSDKLGQARDGAAPGAARRAAEDAGGQAVEEGSGGGGSATARRLNRVHPQQ